MSTVLCRCLAWRQDGISKEDAGTRDGAGSFYQTGVPVARSGVAMKLLQEGLNYSGDVA